MKVVQTIYTGNCWMTGETDVDRAVEVAIVNDKGDKLSRVRFSEGEPEDMTLFRDLSDAYDIIDLMQEAYKLGKHGAEVSFEYEEEEW